MGEDLKNVNLKFRELLEKAKSRVSISKETEHLLYFFFMAGFEAGSGITQVVA